MHATLDNMSIWGLISEASLLVQLVMLSLVLASLISWYLIVLRHLALRQQERHLKQILPRFRAEKDIRQLTSKPEDTPDHAPLQQLLNNAWHEFSLLRQPGCSPEDIRHGVEQALQVTVAKQEAELETGLSMLATIGSVSPYVGLFGTVWGIMNSFIGLSQVQQATLSTVAPGIAEALIATAIGLFAAIPAVIAYNRFSARGQRLIAASYSFGTEIQQRLHRLLCQGNSSRAAA